MRYVAGVLGVNASTIQRTYQRYRDLGTYTKRPGSSHRRATSARDDRFLRIHVLRNWHTTAVEARGRLEQATGVHVSVWTARRRLQEGGLLARRPAMGPLLTRQHHTAYVDFARQHENWNEVQWKRSSLLRRVTIPPEISWWKGESMEENWREVFSPRIPFYGGSVMVWGGISIEASTELVFVGNDALTSHRSLRKFCRSM